MPYYRPDIFPKLIAALLLLSVPSALAGQTRVRVGVFDFNPLCNTQLTVRDTPDEGLFPAILREVAAQEKWQLEFMPGSLPECMQRLETGEIDLVVAATYSKEAGKQYNFTRETVISTWAQVYTSDNTRLQSLLDLAGRNVGVVRDDPYIVELRTMVQRLGIQCTFVEFNTYDDLFRALDEKWIDTGVIDRIYATLHENQFKVQRTPLIFSPVELRFAAAKGKSQALIEALDYHLARFKKDPKSFYYQQITRILGMSEENKTLLYLYGLIATGVLLLLASAASLFLRYQIKVKTEQLYHKNIELRQELAQRKSAEATQLRLMTAIEESDDSIIITDQLGLVQYANPAFERTTGYRCDEVTGQPLEYLARLPQDENTPALPYLPWKGRFTCNRKGGEEYEIDLTLSPVHSPEGHITHYAWVCRDVTNQIRMEQHLRQAQKMEAIGTLAGGIAHDFNNILSPIIGYTEMVNRSLAPGDKQKQRLDNVLVSANRAKELVQQILSFSRRQEEKRSLISIPPIVKETVRLMRASLPATIQISQMIPDCKEYVLADATQMHQVLMNLFTNAYQAMRDGGVLAVEVKSVRVSPRDFKSRIIPRAGNYIRISVSDTGSGMDRDTIEHIYEPYFTTKAPGEGTGLGLFMTHGIVERHDGFIDVQSELGKGTTFQIHLPIAEQQTRNNEITANAPAISGSGHILLVDDEAPITNMLAQMLEGLGYRVSVKNNSMEALHLFREQPSGFDLVITDQTMPHLTGTQLAKFMIGLRPSLPVILCSGFCETLTEDDMRSFGIRRFVGKPICFSEFSHIVHQVMGEVLT